MVDIDCLDGRAVRGDAAADVVVMVVDIRYPC